jgi:hypothetical protein
VAAVHESPLGTPLCEGDFFIVEVLGLDGTARYFPFLVIVLKTRAVEIAGIATDPDGDR